MHLLKVTFAAAALSTALAGTAFAQDSVEDYDGVGCAHMHMKFAAALDANRSAANAVAAQTQAHSAKEYCTRGLFKQGVDGYTKAIEMLGSN